MKRVLGIAVTGLLAFTLTNGVFGQSLGNAGTIEGVVVDPSGAAVARAVASVHNPLSDYRQSTTTASDGSFRLVNIPPNSYHLEIRASSFAVFSQDLTIRNSVPVQIKAALEIAGAETTVTVEASGAGMLELNSSDHVDESSARRSLIARAVWPPTATDSSTPSAITRRPVS
jgi:hypothetical protein